jgi:uncharacterized membrane protein YesL
MRNGNFTEKIYFATTTIFNLVLNNLFFVLCNMPLIFYMYAIIYFNWGIYIIPMIGLLWIATISFTGLLDTIYRLVEDENSSSYKLYFKKVKKAFSRDSLPVFFLLIVVLFIGLFYQSNICPQFFSYLLFFYLFVGILSVLMVSYAAIESVIFKNTIGQTLRNSLILVLKNWKLSLFLIAYFFFLSIVIKEFPAIILFIAFSGYSYLFILFYQKLLNSRIKEAKSYE